MRSFVMIRSRTGTYLVVLEDLRHSADVWVHRFPSGFANARDFSLSGAFRSGSFSSVSPDLAAGCSKLMGPGSGPSSMTQPGDPLPPSGAGGFCWELVLGGPVGGVLACF